MESITQGDLIARKCRDKVRNLLEEIKPQQSDAAIDVIALARKALAFSTEVTEHDDDRRDAYSLLAAALRRSCEFQTNLSFVMESIELERKALDLCAHGHPYRATACENLAKSLLLGFDNNADDLLLFEAQGLQREALATLSADDSRRVASCVSLANVLNKCHGRTGDEHILDEIINLDREVLSLRPVGHPNRAWSCNILANSIWRRTESGADNRLLDEVVDLRREALALCPVEDPNRADFCGSLAFSLEMCHRRSGNDRLLDEAIDLQREVLAILPAEHPGRAFHCTNLSISLQTRYNSNGDDQLLDEAIDIQREALALHPPEPLGRTMCSGHLAMLLKTRYQSCGEDRLLNEAIDMERQALALSPAGYPNRVMYCGNLANSLWTLYDRTRDDRVLNEALDLEREALALQPAGHPNRGIACNNLAMSLQSRFQSSRDGQFLDEAIDLQREALALRPVEHPERAMSCNNLAVLLWSRYDRTGDDRLQDEALKLEREALALRPAGHPKRTLSCNNLANSLWRCYKQSGDVGFLDEAIDLDREALALNPAGHPGRADSCTNLSASLSAHYKHSGDGQLLDEAIILEREAFALRPAGHPDRAMACGNLASALRKCYERGDDDHLLHEIFALQQEAGLRATASAVWRHFCILSWVHLQQRNAPFYNVEEAVVCLSKSIEIEPDEIVAFVGVFLLRLNDVWHHDGAKKHTELTNIYRRFINLMPLLANPALDMLPQLQALKSCTGLGSDAFVNAALAGDWPSGFETLELAQGVIWSQSLHRRDPQLEDVPKPLASKLEKLLRDMSTGSIAHLDERERLSVIPQDVLHAQSSQAYELVREIRALPGLDRFMFGETHDTLCGAASTHPVIVLVGARGYFYALILTASLPSGHVLLPLNLTDRDLDILLHTAGSTRARHAAIASESIIFQGERGMHKTKRTNSTPLDQQLETLWHKIVRPILEHLGLKASDQTAHSVFVVSDKHHSRRSFEIDRACIGLPQASSAHFRFMQPGSMKGSIGCVVLTS
jgi:tetratricopeptide (TPR) repeat protein